MSESTRTARITSDDIRDAGDELAARLEAFADRIDDAASRARRGLRTVEDAAFDAQDGMHRPARRLARAMTDFAGEARRTVERLVEGKRRPWWQRWK